MITQLEQLELQLQQLGCPEFFQIQLLKQAVIGRPAQELKLFKDPKYYDTLRQLLLSMGLKATRQNTIDFLNAAAYLHEGATQNHLLMAGLSIASLVQGMDKLSVILANPRQKPNTEVAKTLAQSIINNQGLIQGKFNQLKISKFAESIKGYIPDGNLLIQYADRMWNEVRTWALTTLGSKTVAKPPENP